MRKKGKNGAIYLSFRISIVEFAQGRRVFSLPDPRKHPLWAWGCVIPWMDSGSFLSCSMLTYCFSQRFYIAVGVSSGVHCFYAWWDRGGGARTHT